MRYVIVHTPTQTPLTFGEVTPNVGQLDYIIWDKMNDLVAQGENIYKHHLIAYLDHPEDAHGQSMYQHYIKQF